MVDLSDGAEDLNGLITFSEVHGCCVEHKINILQINNGRFKDLKIGARVWVDYSR